MTALELRKQLKERIQGLQAKKADTIARCNAEVAVIDARLTTLRSLDDLFGSITFTDGLNALDNAGQAIEIKWN
jgi:hypothetical protein